VCEIAVAHWTVSGQYRAEMYVRMGQGGPTARITKPH
jgi:hypothetical protein